MPNCPHVTSALTPTTARPPAPTSAAARPQCLPPPGPAVPQPGPTMPVLVPLPGPTESGRPNRCLATTESAWGKRVHRRRALRLATPAHRPPASTPVPLLMPATLYLALLLVAIIVHQVSRNLRLHLYYSIWIVDCGGVYLA
jgi:hypothetical protein